MASLPSTSPSVPGFFGWLSLPLSLPRLVTASLILIASGTIYCTLYCLIAFPPMHHRMMPVGYSAAWATFTFVPWFLAFEAVKRIAMWRPTTAVAAGGSGLAIIAACCSVGLETFANVYFGVQSRALPFQIADQLPALLVTATAFGFGAWRRATTQADVGGEYGDSTLPPPEQIEWITAAGNYVEIRAGSRLLIRRLTMRQAEALLDPAQFLRIHRSALVNRRHVADWRGRTVQMRDGTVLRVGDSHRRKLAALVG
jgi:hypothetical protein